MSAFSGLQGSDILSSARQQERSAAASGLARRPSATPAHLSRVLYIPPHDSFVSSLLLHDLSSEYKHAICHAPMGGSDIIGPAAMGSQLFVTRLATMKKPTGTEEADYAVDAVLGVSGHVTLSLQRIGGLPTTSVRVCLPSSTTAGDFQISIGDSNMHVLASFPVPDTVSSAGIARHPYFVFWPDSRRSGSLQWQIRPIDDGPLRYTLVELSGDDDSSAQIRAIYHHVGRGSSLSMPGSEGVLLVPRDPSEHGMAMELLALASLLGILWRVRAMGVRPPVKHKGGKRPGLLRRLFRG